MSDETPKCHQCDGERFVGSGDEPAPWSFWANLPRGADLAVQMGWVKKVPCAECNANGSTR